MGSSPHREKSTSYIMQVLSTACKVLSKVQKLAKQSTRSDLSDKSMNRHLFLSTSLQSILLPLDRILAQENFLSSETARTISRQGSPATEEHRAGRWRSSLPRCFNKTYKHKSQ